MVEKLTPNPATWGSSSDRKPGRPPFSGGRGSARPTSPTSPSPERRTSPRGSATDLLLLGNVRSADRSAGPGSPCAGQGPLTRATGDGEPLTRQRRHRVAAGERVHLTQLPAALRLGPLGAGVDHPRDRAADHGEQPDDQEEPGAAGVADLRQAADRGDGDDPDQAGRDEELPAEPHELVVAHARQRSADPDE